eukprot:CAMPEP_0177540242 /NCGR_PEP_ID=MMETSP0369-20130122/59461_1 /TAXON_ID=447022 ORGANISM="Scrippsiella hangoei-like, Strain SHHI-4" /NCGR_SAMPLE_ID=MMETSP0369 /ASSEMBLY_ACC=CAM_ASM_000364 /LENGTH=62 /DNA_ID=CAMNT_0019023417 /DNA_START=27 /DNA_END=215 /DNA_ORIENTATION=+
MESGLAAKYAVYSGNMRTSVAISASAMVFSTNFLSEENQKTSPDFPETSFSPPVSSSSTKLA